MTGHTPTPPRVTFIHPLDAAFNSLEKAREEIARLREDNADLLAAVVLARTTLVYVQDVLEDTVRFPELIKLIDAAIAKARETA